MTSPQTGIFALDTNSHAYLEFDLAAAAHRLEAVARVASLRIIDAGCTDEGAEMSEHRVAAPLVGVEHAA
jgi:hypothetical protein